MLSFLPFFFKDKLWKINRTFWICGIPASKSVLDLYTAKDHGPRIMWFTLLSAICLSLPTRPANDRLVLTSPTMWWVLQSPNGFRKGKPNRRSGEGWLLDQISRYHCGKETVFLFFKLSTLNWVANTGERTKDHYTFFRPASSLYSRSTARIHPTLSCSLYFCKTSSKWKFFPGLAKGWASVLVFEAVVIGDGASDSQLGDSED